MDCSNFSSELESMKVRASDWSGLALASKSDPLFSANVVAIRKAGILSRRRLASFARRLHNTLSHQITLKVSMPIKYFEASDVKLLADHLIQALKFKHIPMDRIIYVRSVGSKSRGTIARVHAFPRIWQQSLHMKAHYTIEVISERFDDLSPTEKEKVMIHELLHIPQSFGGGFRHHRDWVTKRRVDRLHAALAVSRFGSSNG